MITHPSQKLDDIIAPKEKKIFDQPIAIEIKNINTKVSPNKRLISKQTTQ